MQCKLNKGMLLAGFPAGSIAFGLKVDVLHIAHEGQQRLKCHRFG